MLEAGLRRDLWSSPPRPLRLLAALGSLYAQAGRIGDARGVLQQAIDQARQGGLLWFLAGMTFELGAAEFVVGNLAEAAAHMRSAHALVETEDDHVFKTGLAGELACVLALSGDAGEARQLALDARAISSGDFALEVLWRRALALVAASEGQFKEARMLSDEARARANASDLADLPGPDARGGRARAGAFGRSGRRNCSARGGPRRIRAERERRGCAAGAIEARWRSKWRRRLPVDLTSSTSLRSVREGWLPRARHISRLPRRRPRIRPSGRARRLALEPAAGVPPRAGGLLASLPCFPRA